MKRIRIYLIAAMLLPLAGSAQSVSGYWYGSAFVTGSQGDKNSYMIELILTENGKSVQGIMNYYFLNLYRSSPVSATFDRTQQVLTFNNVPFVFYGSNPKMDVDCYMGGRFSLVIARAGNSLTGQWKPIENYKNTCPPIQARLNMDKEQKITDSMLQAIRNSKENFKYWAAEPNEKNQSITSNAPNETGTPPSPTSSLNSTQPSPKNTEGTPNTSKNTNSVPVKNNTSSPANTRTDQNAAGQKSNWAAGKTGKRAADKKAERAIRKKTSGDKNKQTTNPPEQTTDDNIVTDPNRVASTTTEKHKKDRKFHLFNRNPSHGEKNEKSIDLYSRPIEVASEVEVEMDTVLISLYDNGETDGDSVSVFFNKKRVVSNHLLSARPFQLKVPLDSLDEYVELTVFAENLGKYPPNTAVMVVNAGDKNYKVVLTSSLEKSASVRIKRKRTGLRIR